MPLILVPGTYSPPPQKRGIHPIVWVIFAIIVYCAYQKDEENLRKKQLGASGSPTVNQIQREPIVTNP